jgi:hypothetical protein
VVYDLETNEAHCLNAFASRLWEACDGGSTVAMMLSAHAWSEGEVEDGLRMLSDAGLLIEPLPKSSTRRRALGRLARAAALPAVVSIMIPEAASAQSCRPNGAGCNASNQCCSGCCKSNGNPAARNFCVSPGPGNQCY